MWELVKKRFKLATHVLVHGLEIGLPTLASLAGSANDKVQAADPEAISRVINMVGAELGAEITYVKGLEDLKLRTEGVVAKGNSNIEATRNAAAIAVESLRQRITATEQAAERKIAEERSKIASTEAEWNSMQDIAARFGGIPVAETA